MMHALLVVVALARAGEAAPPAAAKPEVKASTPAATVASIYTADRIRDPFIAGGLGGGGGASAKPFTHEDFNIHNLQLKGIMKDGADNYAMLNDQEFGVSFVLRRGKLYDMKNKPIANVKGTISAKERTVRLEGPEGDVQVLRLGQTDEEEEGK